MWVGRETRTFKSGCRGPWIESDVGEDVQEDAQDDVRPDEGVQDMEVEVFWVGGDEQTRSNCESELRTYVSGGAGIDSGCCVAREIPRGHRDSR